MAFAVVGTMRNRTWLVSLLACSLSMAVLIGGAGCQSSSETEKALVPVTAVPQSVGKTGHSGFCLDMSGEIKADPSGGTNCTVAIQ